MSAPVPVHVCATCGKAYDPAKRPSPDSYAWSTHWADGVAFWMLGRGICAACFEARARGRRQAATETCGFCGAEVSDLARHEDYCSFRSQAVERMALSRR